MFSNNPSNFFFFFPFFLLAFKCFLSSSFGLQNSLLCSSFSIRLSTVTSTDSLALSYSYLDVQRSHDLSKSTLSFLRFNPLLDSFHMFHHQHFLSDNHHPRSVGGHGNPLSIVLGICNTCKILKSLTPEPPSHLLPPAAT